MLPFRRREKQLRRQFRSSGIHIMALHSILSTASRLALGDARVLMQSVGVRCYTISPRVQMGLGSHSSDNDPDVLHREKEKNLQGQYRGR